MDFPKPPFSPTRLPSSIFSGPRRASYPRDVPPIAELIDLCFAGTLDNASRQMLRSVHWIAQRGEAVWKLSLLLRGVNPEEWVLGSVWEEAGRVVGTITLTLRKPEAGAWLLSNVAVHPDFRRRGYARGLIRHALGEIRSRGGRKVYLQVDVGNETGVRMYRELGFEEIGRRITWARSSKPETPAGSTTVRDPAYRIGPRRSSQWREEYALWKGITPAGFTWNTPLSEGAFRPSAARWLEQALLGEAEKHFLATRDGQAEAALLAFRRFSGWEGYLVQREGTSGKVEQALLEEAWKGASPGWNCLLEAVPESSGTILEKLGFQKRRTFIWMRYTIDGGGP
jgi:ribosomal protein S18 acetylase RimI-like enzyme